MREIQKNMIGQHAIVIGASMGGLLAARALSDHFERVTVLERDSLPEVGQHRKGVPQGRHAHGLLGRGREVMEQFFPGLTADLIARGARSGDTQSGVRWYGGGAALCQAQSGMVGLAVSRPLLEGYIRSRLMALPNVRVLDRCEVLGLEHTPDRRRVSGIRVVQPEATGEEVMRSDLIVDASGRGSQSPKWLEAMGYARPEEEQVRVGLGYASAHFRRVEHQLGDQNAVVVAASPACPRGAAMIAQEGDRWIVSIGGFAGDHAPTDFAGFLEYARTLPSPEIIEVVSRNELLGEIVPFKYPVSLRRHYQRLERFPEGYLVFGDALCSFNPVYGQGMTAAALEALVLHEALGQGVGGLAGRFFRQASLVVDIPWSMAVGNDLNNPKIEGERTPKIRLINWYMSKLFRAAWNDAVVARAFLKVTNLIAPPPSLMRPGIALRVLWWNLRGQPARSTPAATEAPMSLNAEPSSPH